MTNRIRDALKTIEVMLLDHIIVTPADSVSFQGARSALTRPATVFNLFPARNPTMPDPADPAEFDPVLSVYTRAQAIEDGFLVDVSETAREAGFRIPVAVTRSVGTASSPCPTATSASRTRQAACGTCSGWRVTTRSAPPTATG